MLKSVVCLACAGALGTLSRYGLTVLVERISPSDPPWGTAVVNILGCFAGGVFWVLLEDRWPGDAQIRGAVLVGFLGAFTTFSAYTLETTRFIENTDWPRALASLVLHNGLGIAAALLGLAIGRLV